MKINMLHRLFPIWIIASLLNAAPAIAGKPAGFDRDKEKFVQEMVAKHDFDQAWLQQLMTQAKYHQRIIDAISRPAESKPWHQYRPIFVTRARAAEGVTFWNENQALLKQAEQKYGVPPEIIVAIIGVETRYGRHAGKYPVLDSLSTLAFGYPKRSKFFRKQLEEFLLLSREEGLDPVGSKGSYAGAMGKPQFIPSSYRMYAVDFDGDGQRNLLTDNADVIGSVAAYFKRHGWQQDAPTTLRAKGANDSHQHYVKTGMKPSIAVDELRKAGIEIKLSLPGKTLASLIKLEGGSGPEYWLGLNNFYVITRYNHSNLYAMAVYQLSQEIARQHKDG
jgi:membrane-bound lytic murein transglycosylase B